MTSVITSEGSERLTSKQQVDKPKLTKEFFVACIVLSLEYIHMNKIIHRDLKPENLVFDEKGYLRLTDFGIARYVKPENSTDTSGTPGYMGKLKL